MKPLKDYSFIRGVCHGPYSAKTREDLVRELGFAKRLQINSTRFWMSEGFWGDIHGLVYPDGTIRDPAVIAAMFGFFRNRSEDRIRVNANKEGHAYKAVKAVEDALRVEETTIFMSKPKTTDEILEAAEYCVNILEAAEMVPMWNPPSARLMDYRRMPEEKRDVYEIKRFAYEMAELVRENCMF